MSGVSKAISNTLYKQGKSSLLICKGKGDISWKLQAIISAKEHNIKSVAKIFGISRVSLLSWIKRFEREGISGLSQKSGRGRKSILSKQEKERVGRWIHENPNITIKELRLQIESDLEKNVSKSTAHNLIKELGFSYITLRPKHHKQVKLTQSEFKKPSNSLGKQS